VPCALAGNITHKADSERLIASNKPDIDRHPHASPNVLPTAGCAQSWCMHGAARSASASGAAAASRCARATRSTHDTDGPVRTVGPKEGCALIGTGGTRERKCGGERTPPARVNIRTKHASRTLHPPRGTTMSGQGGARARDKQTSHATPTGRVNVSAETRRAHDSAAGMGSRRQQLRSFAHLRLGLRLALRLALLTAGLHRSTAA
jgi:hypothetical protein